MSLRMLLSITLGDQQLLSTPAELLSSWTICAVNDLAAARKALSRHPYPVGLLLLNNTSDADVIEVDALLDAHQTTQWVGVFPAEMIKRPSYRALIVQHLFDFHTWPIDPARLNHTLGHAFGYAELDGPPDIASTGKRDMELVGQSAAMQHLRKQISKVAQTNAPVLIWGESGSGKELTARAIHNCSPRANGPFIAVNCGAMPASLIQSELFGYVRGAFTGAAKEKKGLIESAAGGTLFLDEVGDLPLELLTSHYFKVFAQDKKPRLTGFSNRAMLAIKAHDWPGNVRELINRIRRAMVMSEGRLITPEDLDLQLPNGPHAPNGLHNGDALEDARIRAERDAIHLCLQDNGSNISRAARDLGISRMTLYRLMDKYGITP